MHLLKISVILIILATKQCARFEEPVLDHSSQIALPQEPEKGVPALNFNKGVVDDFSGEIYSWWVANDQIAIMRKGDSLKVSFKNVGPLYTPFGRQITSIDLTEANAIKVRMRAEGKTAPIVRLDLKDNLARTTNSAPSQVKVPVNQGYQDYYFNYKDKYKQSHPDAQIVDPTLISEVMFFINPGMTGWTGTIYIDEMIVVNSESIPKKEGAAGGIVDAFDEDPSAWWTGSSKIALEKVADKDIVKVTSAGAGANFETFGREFDLTDFSKSPIIRLKARAENEAGQENPKIRFALKDKEGFVANEFVVAETIESGQEFKNYFFNFTGKFSQTYPDAHSVNPKEILGFVMFINSGGPAYSGNIYFDEIEVISEQKYNELKNQ